MFLLDSDWCFWSFRSDRLFWVIVLVERITLLLGYLLEMVVTVDSRCLMISSSDWLDSRSLVPQWRRNVLGFVNVVCSMILLASLRVEHRMLGVFEPGHNRLGFMWRPLLSHKIIVSPLFTLLGWGGWSLVWSKRVFCLVDMSSFCISSPSGLFRLSFKVPKLFEIEQDLHGLVSRCFFLDLFQSFLGYWHSADYHEHVTF